MDFKTGRPDHINDWLAGYRQGCWYGFSDNKNQVYANLIVLDGGSKPTESDVNDGLKAMQDAFDAKDYSRKRVKEYPSLGEFADAMYWNSKGDSTKLEAYYAACEKVKTDNPKPS
jgi:hypothetical protein